MLRLLNRQLGRPMVWRIRDPELLAPANRWVS